MAAVSAAEMVDLVPVEQSVTLFGSNDPSTIIVRATALSMPLADVIKKKGLFAIIKGRKHVTVEGWTLLGTMLGVFPVTVWTKPLEFGWEARVEARTLHGEVVGAAESQCTRAESTWKSRDDFALRSMAQTRATSKALRLPLGFVMAIAGYDATPLEEMIEAPPPEEAPKAVSEPPHAVGEGGKDGQAEASAGTSARKRQGAKTPVGEDGTAPFSGASSPPLTLREALEKRYPGRAIIQAQREKQICKDHKVDSIEALSEDDLKAVTEQISSEVGG